MALGRVVPWGNWEEWEQVRVGLFSADPSFRRAALNRVNINSNVLSLSMVCLIGTSVTCEASICQDVKTRSESAPAINSQSIECATPESWKTADMMMCFTPSQVKAWEARGRLPLGAEITACLHELHMRDQGYGATVGASSQPTSEPESLLRLQYAMLVIRLVNGISDSSQKGRVAMSVANLAEDAGKLTIPLFPCKKL